MAYVSQEQEDDDWDPWAHKREAGAGGQQPGADENAAAALQA